MQSNVPRLLSVVGVANLNIAIAPAVDEGNVDEENENEAAAPPKKKRKVSRQ
jgi:hypothetical protein